MKKEGGSAVVKYSQYRDGMETQHGASKQEAFCNRFLTHCR